jgi:hypothetical protein
MWFQDLFNYDFRRTEMCIIPYGTQLGEISFCAYNTGVGWRNIIEKMMMNATVAEWYKQHGRHPVYAGGKEVKLPEYENGLTTKLVVPRDQPLPRRSKNLRVVQPSNGQESALKATCH